MHFQPRDHCDIYFQPMKTHKISYSNSCITVYSINTQIHFSVITSEIKKPKSIFILLSFNKFWPGSDTGHGISRQNTRAEEFICILSISIITGFFLGGRTREIYFLWHGPHIFQQSQSISIHFPVFTLQKNISWRGNWTYVSNSAWNSV